MTYNTRTNKDLDSDFLRVTEIGYTGFILTAFHKMGTLLRNMEGPRVENPHTVQWEHENFSKSPGFLMIK